MGFVKALVARHSNPTASASNKVIAFCQAMKTKTTKAYKFLMANGFGYSVRSLQRIVQRTRVQNDLIIDISLEIIKNRVKDYSEKANCQFFGLPLMQLKLQNILMSIQRTVLCVAKLLQIMHEVLMC